MMTPTARPDGPKVAVVGAGMAGVSCAVALQGHVGEVVVFERSPEPGGRMGRLPGADLPADIGAQFLSVRHPLFRECVQAWHAGGVVREWGGWVVDLCRGDLTARDESEPRYVGVPSMAALVQRLATGVDLRCGRGVEEIEPDGQAWRLFDDRGEYLGRFDVVVIAAAPARAIELLAIAPELSALAGRVRMSAAWVAVLQFAERLPLAFDAAYVHESPLHWIARDNSKPFRGDVETWVLQASPEWSERHLIDLGERVLEALSEAFAQATGLSAVQPLATQLSCWRQSVPVSPLDRDCLYDPRIGIGACGDWCAGPRVESAFISGFAMADRVLRGAGAG